MSILIRLHSFTFISTGQSVDKVFCAVQSQCSTVPQDARGESCIEKVLIFMQSHSAEEDLRKTKKNMLDSQH